MNPCVHSFSVTACVDLNIQEQNILLYFVVLFGSVWRVVVGYLHIIMLSNNPLVADAYIYYVEHVRQTLTFHIIFFMRGFDYHLIRLKVQASISYVERVRQRQTFSHHVLHEEWQQGNLFTRYNS